MENDVLLILRNNLDTIHTVAEWARRAGYSRAYFSVQVKQDFGDTPYTIICREKYKKVQQLVGEDSARKGRAIANEAGFDDVKSLYKFLRSHYNTTLTALRKRSKNRSWAVTEQMG